MRASVKAVSEGSKIEKILKSVNSSYKRSIFSSSFGKTLLNVLWKYSTCDHLALPLLKKSVQTTCRQKEQDMSILSKTYLKLAAHSFRYSIILCLIYISFFKKFVVFLHCWKLMKTSSNRRQLAASPIISSSIMPSPW